MDCGLLLDVIIGQCSVIFKLLSSEDQTLLIRWDGLLVLDLSLKALDGVSWFNVKSYVLARQCSNEDLHYEVMVLKNCNCTVFATRTRIV